MITKEQADLIVQHNKSFNRKDEVINGRNVHQYNYHLACHKDFEDPFHESDIDMDIKGYELRGLTFVEQEDGTYKRTLFMSKFFNLNEIESNMLHHLKDKEIRRIAIKDDGSAIGFVKIGDKIFGKTKYSFVSEQAIAATEIYNKDENIRSFVDWCLENDYSPLFEFISDKNLIVVRYQDTKLRLIQLRDNKTGEYLDIYNLDLGDLHYADEIEKISLNQIIDLFQTIEGIEGYVITFADGHMVKVKTKWYIDRHHIVTEDASKENFIIKYTLEETIDDILAQVVNQADREKIEEVSSKIVHHVNETVFEIQEIVSKFDGDRQKFFQDNKNHKFQGVVMRGLNDSSYEYIEEQLVKEILKKTFRLNQAIDYLKDI